MRSRSQPPAPDAGLVAAAGEWEPKRASVSQRASSVGDTPSAYRGRANRTYKPPAKTWVPVPERASSSAGPCTDILIPRGSAGEGQRHLQRGTEFTSDIDQKISTLFATEVGVQNPNPWTGTAKGGGYLMQVPHPGYVAPLETVDLEKDGRVFAIIDDGCNHSCH